MKAAKPMAPWRCSVDRLIHCALAEPEGRGVCRWAPHSAYLNDHADA